MALEPAPSLDGADGLKVSGRWHSAGRRVVYCAPNPATAVLEQLVSQEIRRPEALQGYRMLELEIPDSSPADRIEVGSLRDSRIHRPDITQLIGDRWLALS